MKQIGGLLKILLGIIFFQGELYATVIMQCDKIFGIIETSITSESCGSQVMCTMGRLTNAGPLCGTTYYTAAGVGPNVLDPNLENSLSYTGNLIINTGHGQLTVTDLGILHKVRGTFSELSVGLSGTGSFQGVTGEVFFYGKFTGTGFLGEMRGEICLPNNNPKAIR